MSVKYPLARVPFSVPLVPEKYAADWWGLQLGNIARASPKSGRRILADDTLQTNDDLCVLYLDATAGNIDFTLLPPAEAQFIKFWLVQVDAVNTVTVIGTVSGVVDPVMTGQYAAVLLACDGLAYYNLAEA